MDEGVRVMWWKVGFIVGGFLVESPMQRVLDEEGAKSRKEKNIRSKWRRDWEVGKMIEDVVIGEVGCTIDRDFGREIR